MRYFEAAIAKDASFAPRISGLGAAHAVLSSPFGGDEPVDALAKAAQAAGRALELDATIAEAHLVLGEVAFADGSGPTPKHVTAAPSISIRTMPLRTPGGLAGCSLSAGRTKRSSGRNVPASWTHSRGGRDIGWILFQSRRYADAIREFHTYRRTARTKREPCVPRLCDD